VLTFVVSGGGGRAGYTVVTRGRAICAGGVAVSRQRTAASDLQKNTILDFL
jgi:hypothetical protein